MTDTITRPLSILLVSALAFACGLTILIPH